MVAKTKVMTTAAKMSGFLSTTIVRACLDLSIETVPSLPQKKKGWDPRARYLNSDYKYILRPS